MFVKLDVDYTMKVPFAPRKKVSSKLVKVGIVFIDNCFFYSFFKQDGELVCGKVEDRMQLEKQLSQQFQLEAKHLLYISVLPIHLVWHKRYLCPQALTQYEVAQQVYSMLENDVPNDGMPIWFDYVYQGQQIDLYVVKQKNAEAELAKYRQFDLNILDVLPRVLLRAFYYEIQPDKTETLLYCYCAEQTIFILYSSLNTEIVVSQSSLAQSWSRFQERFANRFSKMVIYQEQSEERDLSQLGLPENHILLEAKSQYAFLSLGCALWGEGIGAK